MVTVKMKYDSLELALVSKEVDQGGGRIRVEGGSRGRFRWKREEEQARESLSRCAIRGQV